jgi:hypothetical protein
MSLRLAASAFAKRSRPSTSSSFGARQRAAEAQPARAGEAVAGRNPAVGARRPVAEALDLPRIPVEAERRLAVQALKTLEDHEVAACGTSERAHSNLT